MKVFVGTEMVSFDKKDVVGSGGEGTVSKILLNGKRKALKVYEQPTRERSDKLKSFVAHNFRFNDRIIAPEELAFDTNGTAVGYTYSPRRNAIGFTMPLVSGEFAEVKSLANKRYRASFGVTTKDVANAFLDGIPTLSQIIHAQGLVIGDFSDLNTLVKNGKMLFWDADAWQFERYPCPVATADFVDPQLYNVDFTLAPVFKPGNDWYSYAVMLFKSLLLVHPYGGTHKAINDLPERALKHITVFDKNVIYPVVAISPDLLSDDMHNIFEGYFTKGQRLPFPEKVLREYAESLIECTSCGTWFPSTRGTCPVCSAKMLVIIQKPISSTKDIEVVELISVNGQILFGRTIGDEVRVLANEKGRIVLYTKRPNLQVHKKDLFANVPGLKFEMSNMHLYVNQPGSMDVLVYDLATAKLLGKLPTAYFAQNRRAIFRASDNYLFRIEDKKLKYGRFNGNGYEERILRDVVEDQTWFWIDENSDTPSVFGLFQVLRQQMFWLIKDGKFFDVEIPEIDNGEVVVDISAKFSSQGVLLLRKTQLKGKNYLRQDQVDANGKVVFSNRIDESSHPDPSIHGLAYTTGLVLHATDEGVISEAVQTGKTKLFPATKGHVDGGDSLLRFDPSLIVIKQDKVLQIRLR